LFGDRLPLAVAYGGMLANDAVVRGLIGPREVPRLWERHLLNCAVLTELLPYEASVIDIGSGAGLPGVVLAVARPDLTVVLVEPMARRTAFLTEVVEALGLDNVTVTRARAEECAGVLPLADVVTARAVAPLDRLAAWCLPLAALGGRLLALKGASAAEEVRAYGDEVQRLGGAPPVVRTLGGGLIAPPATVVEIVRERVVAQRVVGRPGAGGRQDPGRGTGGRGEVEGDRGMGDRGMARRGRREGGPARGGGGRGGGGRGEGGRRGARRS
jgi:16S rRNA (guanine527-N7)-methyltransferase